MKLHQIPGKVYRKFARVDPRFVAEKLVGISKSERLEVQMFGGEDAVRVYEKASRRHPKLPIVRLKSLGVALARVPERPDEVFLGRHFHEARRKKNRAVKAGFFVKKVAPMGYLKSIHAINTSAPNRQDRPMASYLSDFDEVREFCEATERIYGVFDRAGGLKAYTHGTLCGEVFVLDRFIGHRAVLKHGIMFLLMHELVRDLAALRRVHGVPEWVQHDMYFVSWAGARQFKKEAGFRPYRVKWRWNPGRSELLESLPVDART